MSNTDRFNEMLAEAGKPVVAVFTATWCVPSRLLSDNLITLEDEHDGGIEIMEIDIEEHPEIFRHFDIKATPTMIIFSGSTPLASRMGTDAIDITRNWINEYVQ